MANKATQNKGASALPNSDADTERARTLAVQKWQAGEIGFGLPEGAIVHRAGDPVMVDGPNDTKVQKRNKKGALMVYSATTVTLPKAGSTEESKAAQQNIGLAAKPVVIGVMSAAAAKANYMVRRFSSKNDKALGLPVLTTTLQPINLPDEFGRLRAKYPLLKDKSDAEIAKALGIELPESKTAIGV